MDVSSKTYIFKTKCLYHYDLYVILKFNFFYFSARLHGRQKAVFLNCICFFNNMHGYWKFREIMKFKNFQNFFSKFPALCKSKKKNPLIIGAFVKKAIAFFSTIVSDLDSEINYKFRTWAQEVNYKF